MEKILKKQELNEKSKQVSEQMLGLSDEDLLNLTNPTEEDINRYKQIAEQNRGKYTDIKNKTSEIEKNINNTIVNTAPKDSTSEVTKLNVDNVSFEDVDDDIVYDLVPLPSKGYCYPDRQEAVKVAYLTAEDENILTSLNLLRSGRAIEVLLGRKILDKNLKYKNLLICDRDAIILFLRNTAYGEEYIVTLVDPKTNEEFEYMFDLSTIKSKELNILPNENGEFEYMLPLSKKMVKFKYLTVENEDLFVQEQNQKNELIKKNENQISTFYTDSIIRYVVEFDGNRDKNYIKNRVSKLLVKDAKDLQKYIIDNSPGLDLMVEVEFPSGGTGKVDLPINTSFLWPEL